MPAAVPVGDKLSMALREADLRKNRLRLGLFIAPFHALNESPTLCFERDLELAQFADDLGLAELWYGEHHSGGYETIGSPELMIAAAAQRDEADQARHRRRLAALP